MYVARYAYIDKANAYLASDGKTYYAGGGQFHDVLRVMDKYGAITEDAYSGLQKNQDHHDHTLLDTSMKRYVDSLLKLGKIRLDDTETRQLNDTLDKYLGKVPSTFWFDLHNETPLTFAHKVLPPTTDYIELMSFANLPYYKKIKLVDKFNWAGDSIYNVPLKDFQSMIDTALSKGWSVGWEGDVTNDSFNSYSGFAMEGRRFDSYDSIRVQNYRDETTERDHMLHIVGSGTDEENKRWYYLKNSWGTWLSQFKGYIYMNENYLRLNTVIIMANKEGLPHELKTKLAIK